MRIVMFYHSLVSDGNHGNGHFLRGVAAVLIHRGHDVRIYEPKNNRSLTNRLADHARRSALAGRQTILARHTCARRVRQLLEICRSLGLKTSANRRGQTPCVVSPAGRRPGTRQELVAGRGV